MNWMGEEEGLNNWEEEEDGNLTFKKRIKHLDYYKRVLQRLREQKLFCQV